jgi:hypothetical protein
MATVTQIGPRLGIAPTCAALELPRATYYRRRRPQSALPERTRSPRALSAGKQATVLDVWSSSKHPWRGGPSFGLWRLGRRMSLPFSTACEPTNELAEQRRVYGLPYVYEWRAARQ